MIKITKAYIIEQILDVLDLINDLDYASQFLESKLTRLNKTDLLNTLNTVLNHARAKGVTLYTRLNCILYRDKVVSANGIDPDMPPLVYTRYFPNLKASLSLQQAKDLQDMFSSVGFKTTSGEHFTGSIACKVLTKLWGQNPHKTDVKLGLYSYPALLTVAKQTVMVGQDRLKTIESKDKTTKLRIKAPQDGIRIDLPEDMPILDSEGSLNIDAIKSVHFYPSGFNATIEKVVDQRDIRRQLNAQNKRVAPIKGKTRKKMSWGVTDPKIEIARDQYWQHLVSVEKKSFYLIADLNTLTLSVQITAKDKPAKTFVIGILSLTRNELGIIEPLADIQIAKVSSITALSLGKVNLESISAGLNKVWHDNAKDTTSQSIHFDRFLDVVAKSKCKFSENEWSVLKRSSRKIMFTLYDHGLLDSLDYVGVKNSLTSYRNLKDKLPQRELKNFNSGIMMYVLRNHTKLKALWLVNNLGDFPQVPKPRD